MDKIKSNSPEYQRRRRALVKAGKPTHHEWKRPKQMREFLAAYMRAYRAKVKARAESVS